MLDYLTDSERWRKRAEEMRVLGEQAHDFIVKEILLKLAVDYEKLADRADERQSDVSSTNRMETGSPWMELGSWTEKPAASTR